jgi:hypothetical protein
VSNGDEFVPLHKLLKEDDNAKELKTIAGMENEYKDFLGAIEFTVACYFLEHRKLKDKEVEKAIKNILKHYDKDIEFFDTELEREILYELSAALQQQHISAHELTLICNYVLLAIENKSLIPDDQAYVKWLPCFFQLYSADEMQKYKDEFTKMARRIGMSSAEIAMILNTSEVDDTKEDLQEYLKLQSEFFSLKEEKKLDFVVKNGLGNPLLIYLYIEELDERKDFKMIEKLCKKLMKLTNNFPMFEFLLGLNYKNMNNSALAKQHIKSAIKRLEEAPPHIFEDEEKEEMLNEMKEELSRI